MSSVYEYPKRAPPPRAPPAATGITVKKKKRKSHSETARDWFRRHQRRLAREKALEDLPPESPLAAAWAFFRATKNGGTGISFIDESLRQSRYPHQGPIMEIRDPYGPRGGRTGKTRTLITLAARYVVMTRISAFPAVQQQWDHYVEQCDYDLNLEPPKLPQVIFMDATYDVTPLQLANAILSQLLRQPQICMETIEEEMEDCLSRIHLVQVQEIRDWIPIIECQRAKLLEEDNREMPTLLLWDGYLIDARRKFGLQKEVSRHLARMIQDCPIAFFYTRTSYYSLDKRYFYAPPKKGTEAYEHRRYQAPFQQTVVLERNLPTKKDDDDEDSSDDKATEEQQEFRATIVYTKQQFPYSLSAAGVLR